MQVLNEQQLQAATFGRVAASGGVESGPLLIIAGAGTGKTNTLAHRTAHLILNGVSPDRILLMTFSRRAAQELAERARRIVAAKLKEQGEQAADFAPLSWTGTFHSVANRILRSQAKAIGLEPDFTIMDRGDAADMMDLLRHKLGFSKTGKRFPHKATCVDIYSRAVNAQADLQGILEQDFPWCADWEAELKTLFRAYVEEKLRQVCLDYDDLLLYWYHLAGEPSIAKRIRESFDHVLVDEYQDTNILQAGIGPAMAEKILDFLALNNFDPASLANFKSRITKEDAWPGLVKLLTLVHYNQIPWQEQMSAVNDWYRDILEEHYDNHIVRNGDIEQLSMIARQYPSRERFLTELTLDPPNKTGDHGKDVLKDDDYLILSTVHSAKGQEEL